MGTIGRRSGAVLIAALLLTVFAAVHADAAKLFMVQQPIGGLDRNSGPVLRYDVGGPISAPTFDTSFTDSSFYEPDGLVFGPGGELFVINRGDLIPQPDPSPSHGSITRFLTPTGTPTQHGVIQSDHFDLPSFG